MCMSSKIIILIKLLQHSSPNTAKTSAKQAHPKDKPSHRSLTSEPVMFNQENWPTDLRWLHNLRARHRSEE